MVEENSLEDMSAVMTTDSKTMPSLVLCGVILPQIDSVHNLGVLLDS